MKAEKMLNIVTLYRTSRGYFRSMEEALKKKNRKMENDRGTPVGLEEPIPIKVLTDGTSYFLLELIEIKDLRDV